MKYSPYNWYEITNNSYSLFDKNGSETKIPFIKEWAINDILDELLGSKIGAQDKYYIKNINGKHILVFDSKTNRPIGEISFKSSATFKGPSAMIDTNILFKSNDKINTKNNLFEIDRTCNQINLFDTTKNEKIKSIELNAKPVAMARVGNKLFVGLERSYDSLVIIDTETGEPLSAIDVDIWPLAMIAVGNKLFVSDSSNGTLSSFIIDPENGRITLDNFIKVGARPEHRFLAGKYLFVANKKDNSISVIDTEFSWEITRLAGVGQGPMDLLIAGNKLVCSHRG